MSAHENGSQGGELAALRAEIERIDRAFVGLLVERQRCARRIVEYKQEREVPLRNYSVERQVIDRYESYCAQAGLDPHWGRELAEYLIARSVELQSTHLDRRRSGEARRVLVIGGAGAMGRWFQSFFRNQGHQVDSFDTAEETPELLADCVAAAEIIVISVSLAASPAVLRQVLDLQPRGLLFDVCSVKREVAPLLGAAAGAGMSVTSIHPLFGPDVRTLSGRNIVICPCGNSAADAEVAALFAETAATVIYLDPDEHDRLMSLTLGMSHALNLLFARALTASGAARAELAAVASSTFSRQMETTKAVASENMELYYEIQRQCDHETIYRLLGDELAELARQIGTGARQRFLTAARLTATWFTAEEERHDEHA